MQTQLIGIIGLQRLGASAGLAFKKSPLSLTIAGHDRDRQAMKVAQEMGAVDKTYTSVANLASDADILILAEPYTELEATFKIIGPYVQEHTVVVDFSTLKRPVQQWADTYLTQGHYVCCMPVMGVQGLGNTELTTAAAHADLFRESVMCLMPTSTVDDAAVETATNLGRLLGCQPFYVDIHEYDTYIQLLETIPGLLAASFFRTATQTKGWRDMVRLAGLPFAAATSSMGREADVAHLAFADKAAVLHWLDKLTADLTEMRRWIQEGDQETLSALMTELNIQRDEWLHKRQENNWQEAKADVEAPGLMQLIGGGMFKRKKKS